MFNDYITVAYWCITEYISGRDEIEKIFINFFLTLEASLRMALDKNGRPLVITCERTSINDSRMLGIADLFFWY